MMIRPGEKHDRAGCQDCYETWAGPGAFTDGTFHEQVYEHRVLFTALVRCLDETCCPQA